MTGPMTPVLDSIRQEAVPGRWREQQDFPPPTLALLEFQSICESRLGWCSVQAGREQEQYETAVGIILISATGTWLQSRVRDSRLSGPIYGKWWIPMAGYKQRGVKCQASNVFKVGGPGCRIPNAVYVCFSFGVLYKWTGDEQAR